MERKHWAGLLRGIAVAVVVLGVSAGALANDSDCWCAQFVDLQDEVPTRGSSVLLRLAASAGLTGVTFWAADALGLPNAQWVKVGALVSGVSSSASALADLLLPTQRGIDRAEQDVAESVLSEDLCQETLAGFARSVRSHRFISGAIDIGSGLAQLALLSPYGTYATGDIYDYVYLVTGGIDLVGGALSILFQTPFERGFRDARELCGE